ncbi:hypothetical protein DPMN_118704 [Dreissena polymorpha]|uniref:Uncharacterized protein n=1 Tax=Dreissena polymorpha TaxID=45954 RepID=A0A9D4JNR3_DREPO|nr:hypothetical protein DPMN_118704 [Dreissena polymorpha]
MNLLTKFHEDQTINLASREKNAPPHGSDVFQANVTIFELIQDIIETNLLTKFHEDWTINVASRELTRQMLTRHDGRRTTDKKRSQKLTTRTLCSAKTHFNALHINSRGISGQFAATECECQSLHTGHRCVSTLCADRSSQPGK